MKSIEKRFQDLQRRRPGCSSIINFAGAIKSGKFASRVVSHWFNRLVEKDDFSEVDRRTILENLNELTGSRTVGNGVKFRVRRTKIKKTGNGAVGG